MKELWKPVTGYERFYEVSNWARVKSLFNGRHGFYRDKILKPQINKEGYLYINLSLNGVTKPFYIHRLVALAFIPNPENKPQVDHINKIRDDNRVKNLQWLTASENTKKSFDQGKINSDKQRLAAAKNGKSCQKISTWYNERLNLEFVGNPYDLVRAFPDQKLHRGHLSEVRTSKSKGHKGWTIKS